MPFKKNDPNNNMVDGLVNLIAETATRVVKRLTKDYPRNWSVKVVETSGTIAPNSMVSVYLNADDTSVPQSYRNKSWENLNANDECYLYSPDGKLNNAVILFKK